MTGDKKNRILVVDDEINVCKSIKMAIQGDDCEIDTALSGEEALKKNQEKAYDLVVTDLMMPGISGLDLLKSILKESPDTRVIMITGYPTIKTAVESVKSGAFDYIPKPFTPKDLRDIASRALKAASPSQEKKEEQAPQLPPGCFYLSGFSWLRKEEENQAVVGIMYDFIKTLAGVTGLETPPVQKNIYQGEAIARILDKDGRIHRVWSPVSGRIIEINPLIQKNLNWLKESPYDKGWLMRLEMIRPQEDLTGLEKS